MMKAVQMDLFGEPDPISEICDWIIRNYESAKRHEPESYIAKPGGFELYVLREFSRWHGGNSTPPLGYRWFQFDPKGLTLEGEGKKLFIPKAKILRQLQIRDKETIRRKKHE